MLLPRHTSLWRKGPRAENHCYIRLRRRPALGSEWRDPLIALAHRKTRDAFYEVVYIYIYILDIKVSARGILPVIYKEAGLPELRYQVHHLPW